MSDKSPCGYTDQRVIYGKIGMADGIESILYNGTEVACVYRKDLPVSGLRFLTPNSYPFQIGIHERPKGTNIKAHLHNCPKPIEVTEIQEFLYVVWGSITVTILTEDKTVIDTKILGPGDSILLCTPAHRVEFSEDARIIELKQGPYPGPEYAKRYLE